MEGWSQVSCVGKPQPRTWDDYEEGCIGTYCGGHHEPNEAAAFVHGMRTVFNLLRAEFPPAEAIRELQNEIDELAQGNLAAQHRAAVENKRLRGVLNLLADKLACYTGYTIPHEIREAEAAERAGAESYDSIQRIYVDEQGRKLNCRPGGEEE